MNREELTKGKRFLEQMFIEMDNNSYKGSLLDWKNFDNMITELEYHKAKMMMSIRAGDSKATKEYIADCANILLAIGNLVGLYEEGSVNDGMCSETKKDIFNRVPNNSNDKSFELVTKK